MPMRTSRPSPADRSVPQPASATTPAKARTTPAEPTRRRARTAARLLEAAREVFAEKGFGAASVEDVCERAGFTRGALYSNFTSKDDLVLRLLDVETDAVLVRIEQVTQSEAASVEDLVELALGTVSGDAEEVRRRHLLDGEFALHAVRDPEVGQALAARETQVRDRLAALIEDAIARRGLTLAVPAEEVARAVTAVHEASVAEHLLDPAARPVDALERAVLPALIAGLTRRG